MDTTENIELIKSTESTESTNELILNEQFDKTLNKQLTEPIEFIAESTKPIEPVVELITDELSVDLSTNSIIDEYIYPNNDEKHTMHLIQSIYFNEKNEETTVDYKFIDNIRQNIDLKSLTKNQYTLKNERYYEKVREIQEWYFVLPEWCNIYYYENYVKNEQVGKFNVELDYDYEDEDIMNKNVYTFVQVVFVEFDCRNLTNDIIYVTRAWKNTFCDDAEKVIEEVPIRMEKLSKFLDGCEDEKFVREIRKMMEFKECKNDDDKYYKEAFTRSQYSTISTCFHAHECLLNGIMIEDNDNIYPYYQKKLLNKLEISSNKKLSTNKNDFLNKNNVSENDKSTYDLTELPVDIIALLKTKLYDNQLSNINWMTERENNPIRDYFTDSTTTMMPDGRIWVWGEFEDVILSSDPITPDMNVHELHRHVESKKSTICGGIIADDKNMGKTLQVLTHALTTPELKTVILVNNNDTKQHWNSEIKKHFVDNVDTSFIEIMLYSDFCEYSKKNKNVDRLVIDKVEELYKEVDDNTKPVNCYHATIYYKCKSKWIVSSNPFADSEGIFRIMRILIGGFTDSLSDADEDVRHVHNAFPSYKHYQYLYPLIIRRNVKDNDDDKILSIKDKDEEVEDEEVEEEEDAEENEESEEEEKNEESEEEKNEESEEDESETESEKDEDSCEDDEDNKKNKKKTCKNDDSDNSSIENID